MAFTEKYIKPNTKQADTILYNYKMYSSIKERGLYSIYEKPSKAKVDAYYNCLKYAQTFGKLIDVVGEGSCHTFSLYVGVDCGMNDKIIIQFTKEHTRILKGVQI